MRLYLTIAARNVLQARRRSLFLTVALALVTALLVILNSLSEGVSTNLVRAATTLSAGHVNVAGFHKTTSNDSSPIVTEKSKLRDILEKRTPHLEYMVDRTRGWGKLVSASASIQSGVYGIEATQEEALFSTLQQAVESDYVEGGKDEVLGDPRRLAERGTVMLFASQAERLEVTVGDVVTLRAENPGGKTNTVDLTVVAVAQDMGMLSNFFVFLPTPDVLDLYQLAPTTTGSFMLYLDDIAYAHEVMGKLRVILEEEGYVLMDYRPEPFFFKFEQVAGEDWTGQKLDLTTWEDEVSFLSWVVTALDTVTFALIAVLFAIIAIGIANTMVISVRERTREIGTIRAIGTSRPAVLLLFMLETFLLSAFATVVGALLGAGVATLVDRAEFEIGNQAMSAILLSDTLHLEVDLNQTLFSVVLLTGFSALAALLPALRAARMQPVEALQSIE